MSLLGRAALFALREVAKPTLERIGQHLGDAIGTVAGRKIDPEHGKDPKKSEETPPS